MASGRSDAAVAPATSADRLSLEFPHAWQRYACLERYDDSAVSRWSAVAPVADELRPLVSQGWSGA